MMMWRNSTNTAGFVLHYGDNYGGCRKQYRRLVAWQNITNLGREQSGWLDSSDLAWFICW